MGGSTRSMLSKKSLWLSLAASPWLGYCLGCQSVTPQPSGPAAAAPSAVSAEVFFCETSAVECRTTTNDFTVTEVRDLFVFVAWQGVSGLHAQELRFVLPDGNLYQNKTTKFTAETGSTPIPDVQIAKLSQGEPTVVSALPVGGTFITQHFLTGTWAVEVYLDGAPVTQAPFVLRPPQQQ